MARTKSDELSDGRGGTDERIIASRTSPQLPRGASLYSLRAASDTAASRRVIKQSRLHGRAIFHVSFVGSK